MRPIIARTTFIGVLLFAFGAWAGGDEPAGDALPDIEQRLK